MEDIFKENKPNVHNCIIAVDETGIAILLKSEPSLYGHDVFDGFFLSYNINKNEKDIPKEFGIYSCKIMVYAYSYWTDSGTEYDCNTWLEDVIKLEIPNV